MRLCSTLVVLLSLGGLLTGGAKAAPLEGCPDPVSIANALAGLSEGDWRAVSVARLKELWPTELVGVDCDSTACSSVESRGRIINGHYECSEIFFFDIQRNANETPRTQLKNLVIHYSTRERKKIMEAAKVLARATGISGAQAAEIGRESRQDFHWQNDGLPTLSGLSVEIAHKGKVWTVTLNLSHFPR